MTDRRRLSPATWAPPSLTRRHNLLDEDLSTAPPGELTEWNAALTTFEVLGLLTRHPDMERVWRSLRERRGMSDDQVDLLANVIVSSSLDYLSIERLPPARHHAYFSNVAEQARRLAEAVSDSLGRQRTPLTDYVDTCLLQRYLRRAGVPDDTLAAAASAVKEWMSVHQPTFGDALDDLAIAAERAAAIKPTLRKPESKEAKAHFLALRLGAFFRRHLNSPLHEQVATITNVVCDSQLEPEAVRKLSSRHQD